MIGREYTIVSSGEPLSGSEKRRTAERRQLLKGAACGALGALALVAAGWAGLGKVVDDDPFMVPKNLQETYRQYAGDGYCPEVDWTTEQRVGDMLASLPAEAEHADRDKFAFAREAAERNGLTLIDPEPFIQHLNASETPLQTTEALAAYTAQFDVSLNLDPAQSATAMKPLPFDALDGSTFRRDIGLLMRQLSFVPLEVVEAGNVRQLTLAQDGSLDTEENGKLFQAVARAHPSNHEIIVTREGILQENAFLHEIKHLLDKEYCGPVEVEIDNGYRGLNPPGFTYTHNGDSRYATEVVARNHGSKNVKEDKAVVAEDILDGINARDFNDDVSSVVRTKYVLLTQRLEEEVPGAAPYLIALGSYELEG